MAAASTFGSIRFPRPLDEGRFLVATPAQHRDADELERADTGAAILECRPDGDLDGDAFDQEPDLRPCRRAAIGAEGNLRVCMENLRVVPALSRTDASTARTSAHEGIPKAA
jgi:hypothetical protein